MGRCEKIGIFRFSRHRPAIHHCRQIGQWALDRHRSTGRQCVDAILEAGVGADGQAFIHTGTGSGGLGRVNGGDGLPTKCPAM